MYNGIGLVTPRGSATSGYVQRNLSFLPQKQTNAAYNSNQEYLKSGGASVSQRRHRPTEAVLLHMAYREIESECFDMRLRMVREGKPREEIDTILSTHRKTLRDALEAKHTAKALLPTLPDGRIKIEKDVEMERARRAFRVPEGYQEGRAFDFESKESAEEKRARSETQRRQEGLDRLMGIKKAL